MLHQKQESYKYVLLLKNLFDWTTTRQEKMSEPQKYLRNFEKKCPKIKIIWLLRFDSWLFTLDSSWAKKVVKSILETWNINNVIVMFILFIFG